MNRRRSTLIVAAAIAAAAASILYAGDLNPPAGPIAPTMKPLTDIEPRTAINATNTPGTATAFFRITTPGSYYVTANLAGVASKSGIEIAASDVTLDLAGFRLQGIAGSLAGITITSGQTNTTIKNGTIRGWAGGGISAGSASDCTVENITAVGNTGHGMQLGVGAIIHACHCVSNTQSGINTLPDAVIDGCICRANGQAGVTTGDHSLVAQTVSQGNTGTGMNLGAGNLVAHDVIAQNSTGVSASSGLNVVGSIARNNTGPGFTCFGAAFTSCVSTVNTGAGFSTDAAMISSCRSTGNGGEGYTLGNNSLLIHSMAASNTSFGAHAGTNGYVLESIFSLDDLTAGELREVKFDSGGRVESNQLYSTNANLWGVGGTASTLMVHNSLLGGFVPTFGGMHANDIFSTDMTGLPLLGNFDLP